MNPNQDLFNRYSPPLKQGWMATQPRSAFSAAGNTARAHLASPDSAYPQASPFLAADRGFIVMEKLR